MVALSVYPWVQTERRRLLKEQVKKVPDAAGKDFSDVLEIALEEYIKHHARGNPAFTLERFSDPNFVGLPTLGEAPSKEHSYNEKDWKVIKKHATAWIDKANRELSKPSSKGKVKEIDVEWLMKSRGVSRDEATKHLREQGYE